MFARITISHCLSLAAFFAAFTLCACGSGPGTAGNTPQINRTQVQPAAVNGTGIEPANAYGRKRDISGFWVNGVHFDASAAMVTIDGRPDVLTNIAGGDVVNIRGKVQTNRTSGGYIDERWSAETIVLDHLLLGRITSVDLASGSFVALGQTVRINAWTTFGDRFPGWVSSLKPDRLVAVSGFRTAQGEIYATRIGTPAADVSEFRAIGEVTELSDDRLSFTMNSLTVDVSAAVWPEGMNADALARGTVVDVWGTERGPAELEATRVAIRSYIDLPSPGTRVEVEALVTDIDASDRSRFTLGGTLEVLSAGATIEGAVGLDTLVEVEGVAAANGAAAARMIRLPFTPSPGAHTVSGYFYDSLGGAVVNHTFNLFVNEVENGRIRFGYSYWLVHGPISTGPSGQFVAPGIPHNGRIVIDMIHRDFVQPCAVVLDVDRDMSVNIELLSRAALDSLTPPRPQTPLRASISGTIYEMTPTGRGPVTGAAVWAEDWGMVQVADTLSDAAGNYFLCNLPLGAIGVFKEGFDFSYVDAGDTSVSHSIDIELRRR